MALRCTVAGADFYDMTLPSDVDEHVGIFDRFAERCSTLVSRAPFFIGISLFITLWLIQGFIEMAIKGPSAFVGTTYQLEVNTTTTIITVLLLSLLENAQARGTAAIQKKLNAIADALADLMEHEHPEDAAELRAAVGLEERESTTD